MRVQMWDINNPKASPPGAIDIVVASNLSNSSKDLRHTLHTLHKSLNVGGFVHLQEFMGPLGAAVNGLRPGAWMTNDDRECGPCASVAQWRQMLAEAGFDEVMTVR